MSTYSDALRQKELCTGIGARIDNFISDQSKDPSNLLIEGLRLHKDEGRQKVMAERHNQGLGVDYDTMIKPDLRRELKSKDMQDQYSLLKKDVHEFLIAREAARVDSHWRRMRGSPGADSSLALYKSELTNDVPSLRALIETLHKAPESKDYIENTKSRGVLGKLFKSLEGYSGVFSIIPNNEYTSLICGTIGAIVKTASTWIRITEDFNDSLENVFLQMDRCQRNISGLHSAQLEHILVLHQRELEETRDHFISQLFRYFSGVLRWFGANKFQKALKALNSNSRQDSKDDYNKVLEAANLLEWTCNHVRWQMDVERDNRRDKDMQQFCLGLVGTVTRGLLASHIEAHLSEPLKTQSKRHKEPQPSTYPRQNAMVLEHVIPLSQQRPFSEWHEQLGKHTFAPQVMLSLVSPPYIYMDSDISDAIMRWSEPYLSATTWIYGLFETEYPSSVSGIAKRVVEFATDLTIPVVFFFCNDSDIIDEDDIDWNYYNPRSAQNENESYQGLFVVLIYSLIEQMITLLPPGVECSEQLELDKLASFDGTLSSLAQALPLLEYLFSVCPKLLIVVIDGIDRLASRGIDKELCEFVSLLARVQHKETAQTNRAQAMMPLPSEITSHGAGSARGPMSLILKVFFTTTGPCNALEECGPPGLDIITVTSRRPRDLASGEGALRIEEDFL